jgi:hypothetical protein
MGGQPGGGAAQACQRGEVGERNEVHSLCLKVLNPTFEGAKPPSAWKHKQCFIGPFHLCSNFRKSLSLACVSFLKEANKVNLTSVEVGVKGKIQAWPLVSCCPPEPWQPATGTGAQGQG